MSSITCRSCGSSRCHHSLDLGLQPLANNLLNPADLGKPEPKFPLRVFVCKDCWLFQIAEMVPPVELFSDYLYFSSFSDAMLSHAREAAHRYVSDYELGPQSLVVEVASNDGYLLKNFVAAGVPCLGVEPAANIAEVARKAGVDTIVEFFGAASAAKVAAERGRANLILGNNVFAHAPDINDFVAGIKNLLAPGGRAIIEFPHGAEMVEKNEFDTIYHEHVFYFTLTTLVPVFERAGLSIVHVERLPIHGGSLRIFIRHAGEVAPGPAVAWLLQDETARGVKTLEFYDAFARRADELRTSLRATLARLRSEGRRIAAYGASAKGSTLLNYVGLEPGTLEFVADRSTVKQGKLTPGTHLPILPPEALVEKGVDCALLLTWNFADEIMGQQEEFRRRGGHFVVPIPSVRVVPPRA
jgi:SAM-dependent methyltransferase